MNFHDIKQLPRSTYRADIPWLGMERFLNEHENVVLEPDFQRAHVWNKIKQTKYIEWILSGGNSGKDMYFNCSSWMSRFNTPLILVDGLQRLTAVRLFLANRVKAFGLNYRQFSGDLPLLNCNFSVSVATLKTKRDVLEWYLAINSGGVVHKKLEIERVKLLRENTPENEAI